MFQKEPFIHGLKPSDPVRWISGKASQFRKRLKEQDKDIRRLTYGRIRMFQTLTLKQPEGVHIPSERTVYRVMEAIGFSHRPRSKPNGITKADREAHIGKRIAF